MKKVIFSLALLLTCSLLGFAQKGISYQAVILDPNPIEIPGQDITGQPFVNGAVSLKFKIFSSNLVQEFEEVHATQTDAYGMVNVLIGSVSQGAFSSLVWDSNPKNMQVWVSFDNGGTYTKVSEQVLTYNPYAIYAETAGKLGGTLGIAGGGTGATTAAAARTNLGLGNVDNTADVNKPISTATQSALATKANADEVNTALATKANAAEVNTALATKANAAEVNTALATKANASDVTTSLGLKEDVSNKANTPLGTSTSLYPTQNAVKTYVDAQIASATIPDADASNKGKIQLAGDLAGTAAAPTVPGLAAKANASDVTTSLALKEDVSNKSNTPLGTSTSLYPTQNAVKTYVDAQVAAATIPDANSITKGKIQLAGDLGGTAAAPTVPGLTLKLDANQKGVANGVASLNASGIIPSSQLPPVTVSSTTVVGSDAAMIALSNQTVGSIAVRTDVNKNYVLSALPASTLGNWIELLTPGAPVQTVNGYIGTVNLTKTDLGLSNVNNTSDLNKPISTATQSALDLKANGATVDAALATKLSTSDATAALSLKANSADVTTALATKLSTADATAALALKANSTDVTNALATKLSTADATAALALKANSTDVTTALATKLSTADATAALALKANTADMTTALATKISNADATAALALKLDANKVAAANGVASLDALGKVPTDQIPAVSFSSVKVLGSEAEMLGLGSAVVGSVVIRTDESKNYVLSQPNPAVRANWIQLLTPAAPVQAVNGKTGTVSITATDLGLGNVENTTDANKPVSSATQTELDKKVDKVAGKNLSTNDYTTAEKDKLAAITGITNLATSVSGTLAVANGGTGATTLSGLVKGNGTSAFTAAVAGTDYQAPLTLTTTGSGAATLSGTTLNIPATTNYALPTASASDLGGVKVGTNLSISGGVLSADLSAANISGTVAVGKGGTGATTLAANNVLLGNGTSALQVVAPGASGNVLTSNGTTWTSAAGGVPYSGATAAVNLGAYDLKVNNLTIGRGKGGVESNTAIGLASLGVNTTGTNNTGAGYATLAANTEGIANTATGYGSLVANTTGSNNTAVGSASLVKNQTGSNNTALGYVSLSENLSGINNTGVGSYSLWKNTGSGNSAVGFGALVYNTNGSNNVAQGLSALQDNTSGSDNTAVGKNALLTNKTGNFNTVIGSNANVNADNLSNSIAIGYGARVYTSNTIQLGPDGNSFETNSITYPTTAITNVKTTGTLTLKDVTYPNTHRSTAGDVLTINSSGTASWAAPSGGVSGTVTVGNGGTGATTLTSGALLKGNGTSAISAATAGTDYSAGTSALGTGILKSTTSTGALTIATAADFPTLNQNTTGNAGNVTGTVAVANGGTGATTLTGYVKGTGTTAMTASASIPLSDVTGAAPIASPTFTGTLTAPIYASTPQALTDAGTISWNPSSGLNASVTLAGNRTLSFSTAPPTGAYGTLVVKQDATGSRTLTLPSVANKILGSSSTTTIGLSTAANAIDIVNFYFDGTNYFWNVGQGYGTAATSSATNIAGGVAGSIPYQTAVGATSLLPKGTDGQILTLASGLPSWAAAPATGVTSVGMTTPTGLSVSGSPITSSGTLALSMATGYAIPATTSQTNWDAAYTNRITSASSPLSISSNAISLGIVPIANGGTNSTATPTSGGVGYGTGTAHAYTSAGTSGQVLTSAGAGAPTWSTLAAVRMNSDEFTATAAQTVFTFTTTSSTTGAVQTPLSKPFMYINGIRIKNAAFTWTSGTTTVTYNPANNNSYTLVAGDRITFDYAY
jgi:hypothetical protein